MKPISTLLCLCLAGCLQTLFNPVAQAGPAGPVAVRQVARGHVEPLMLTSRGEGQTWPIKVWVPDQGKGPRNILILFDGQNGFDPSPYSHADWGIAQTVRRLMAEGRIGPTLIVAIELRSTREADYMPQQVVARLDDEAQAEVAAYAHDRPRSDSFLRFVTRVVMPALVREFGASPARHAHMLMGASMGGHIALYAQGEYPEMFGASASLSMPWVLGDLSEDPAITARRAKSDGQAFGAWLRHSRLRHGRNRLYVDRGTEGLEARFIPYETEALKALHQAGWSEGRGVMACVIKGANHSETDWRRRLEAPILYGLGRAQPACPKGDDPQD